MMRFLKALVFLIVAACAVADGQSVEISNPVLVQPPPGARVAAGYLTLLNTGGTELRLTGARSSLFGRIEIHLTIIEEGIARMRHLSTLQLPTGETLTFEPGGYHLMFIDPLGPLAEEDRIPVTLEFGSDVVEVVFVVVSGRNIAERGDSDHSVHMGDGDHSTHRGSGSNN